MLKRRNELNVIYIEGFENYDSINIDILKIHNDTDAKCVIESIADLQKNGFTSKCPRCGKEEELCCSEEFGAISRRADVYVCSECGSEEAMEDYCHLKKLPLIEWSCVKDQLKTQ